MWLSKKCDFFLVTTTCMTLSNQHFWYRYFPELTWSVISVATNQRWHNWSTQKKIRNFQEPLTLLEHGNPPGGNMLEYCRCCGSVTFWYLSGSPDPNHFLRIRLHIMLFLQWLTRCHRKISFFVKVFCWLLLEGAFSEVFKDKKSKTEEVKNSTNHGFHNFLLDDGRIWFGKAQKHPYPDPQPWWLQYWSQKFNLLFKFAFSPILIICRP